jgi:syntaxin 1B/2/3
MQQDNRSGNARAVIENLNSRSKDLEFVLQRIQEVHDLMIQLAEMVANQEEPLKKVNEQTEETMDQLHNGNLQLDPAIKSSRAARRKKWICLGIVGESKF